MSNQASPDPELSFFRAWSLRPKARRACSSDTEVSPKATPTSLKGSIRARRPEHVRLKSEHFLERIGLRDRSDKSLATSEEDVVALKLGGSTPLPVQPEPVVAASPDVTPRPYAGITESQPRPTATRVLTTSEPSTPGRRNGVYKRALLHLGVASKQTTASRPRFNLSPARSFTGQILDRASTILRHIPEKRLTPTSSQSSNLSTTGSSAPHSYLSPLRRAYSNSSSLRSMLMGRVPLGTPATPDSHVMYIGSDQKQYFRVEISAPGAPTYLPSEARRIGTPPLLEQNGKARGFFFSYDVLDEQNTPSSGAGTPSRVRSENASDIDWYSVKLKADEARDNAMSFELNVPEHLPSSPLCPKHPKHKSGGKGVCVYHGRNRQEVEGL